MSPKRCSSMKQFPSANWISLAMKIRVECDNLSREWRGQSKWHQNKRVISTVGSKGPTRKGHFNCSICEVQKCSFHFQQCNCTKKAFSAANIVDSTQKGAERHYAEARAIPTVSSIGRLTCLHFSPQTKLTASQLSIARKFGGLRLKWLSAIVLRHIIYN